MKDLDSKYSENSLIIASMFNVYIIAWWLEVGKRIAFFDSIRFEFLLGGILSVIAITKMRGNKNNSDIVPAIWLFIVTLSINIPFSLDFELAWNTYVDRVLKFSLMGFFISQFVKSPKGIKHFSFCTLLAFLKIGQEAMVGRITGSMYWESQGILRLHGGLGTMFAHPNSLSGKTLSLLPFLLYVWPNIKKKWVKSLVIVQFIFSLNIILFTGSRTGYITFLLMIFFIFYFSKKNKRAIVMFFILLLTVSIFAIPAQYQERFLSSFSGHEKEGRSKEARILLFRDSLHVFIENPIGVGPFCFPVAQQLAGRRNQETHNLYTQLLSETGIQGFLTFIILIYFLMKKAFKLRDKFKNLIDIIEDNYTKLQNNKKTIENELSDYKYLYAVTNSIIVFTLVRLVLGFFGHDLFEIYWWISIGLTMALENIYQVSKKRTEEIMNK